MLTFLSRKNASSLKATNLCLTYFNQFISQKKILFVLESVYVKHLSTDFHFKVKVKLENTKIRSSPLLETRLQSSGSIPVIKLVVVN